MSVLGSLAMVIGYWMIFTKLGRMGWESIIPFYGTYVICEEIYGNGLAIFGYLVPFYNIYFYFKTNNRLAEALGQPKAMGWGLSLLPPVFALILGFSDQINNLERDIKTEVKTGHGMDKVKEAIRTEKPQKKASDVTADSISSRLESLKSLKESGLISEEEYKARREAIFEGFEKNR